MIAVLMELYQCFLPQEESRSVRLVDQRQRFEGKGQGVLLSLDSLLHTAGGKPSTTGSHISAHDSPPGPHETDTERKHRAQSPPMLSDRDKKTSKRRT